MDTTELKLCLEQYEFLNEKADGVFPADQLPKITKYPSTFIANTDESTKSGQHWLAFYVADDKNIEFFDSYGLKPQNKYFVSYIKKYKNKVYNKKRLQGHLSTTCGQYSVSFIFHRSIGITLKDFVERFSKSDLHENDHLVQDMVEHYFDYSRTVYNNHTFNQVCKALGH